MLWWPPVADWRLDGAGMGKAAASRPSLIVSVPRIAAGMDGAADWEQESTARGNAMIEKQRHSGHVSRATPENDLRIEEFLGQLLRAGVGLAALVVLAGGIMYLKSAPSAVPDYTIFRGQPQELTSLHETVQGSADFKPLAIIQLGLLLLIATPVARVAFSILGFAMERDWLYIGVTLIVLFLLLYSLTGDMHLFFDR